MKGKSKKQQDREIVSKRKAYWERLSTEELIRRVNNLPWHVSGHVAKAINEILKDRGER